MIKPMICIQKEGYSDIEQRNLNYTNLMTDLAKEKWFNNR